MMNYRTITLTSKATMRVGAYTSAPVLKELEPGTQLEILSEKNV
jgi:hypothetical protein